MTKREALKRLSWVFAFVAGLGVAAIGYSYFIEPHKLVVTRAEIEVENWNRAFEGLRIVMISDIHGGSNDVTVDMIDRVVETANAENADLVVLLGDFVSQTRNDHADLKMPIELIAEHLKPLRARYGVYAVLGNHDIWNDAAKISATLEANGIPVLEHEVETIDIHRGALPFMVLQAVALIVVIIFPQTVQWLVNASA